LTNTKSIEKERRFLRHGVEGFWSEYLSSWWVIFGRDDHSRPH